jgi:hypothetical protein
MSATLKVQPTLPAEAQHRFHSCRPRKNKKIMLGVHGTWRVVAEAPNITGDARWYAFHACGSKVQRVLTGESLRRKPPRHCPDCNPPVRKVKARGYSNNPKKPHRVSLVCKLCSGLPRGVTGPKCKGCGLERGE